MKVKIVKRGGKYIRKFSLETEDWLTIIFVILVLGMTITGFILRG